ncbi:MAG: hypothetical protein AAGE43_04810 [Pseudomonadota bacterium]
MALDSSVIPAVAAALFLAFLMARALNPGPGTIRWAWLVPASLSLLFAAFSVIVILNEGPLGFWTEHVRGGWGNQIWIDLLLAIGIGWYLLVPPAQELGMRPLPWLAAVVLSGCIGLLAMLARYLYLRERAAGLDAVRVAVQAADPG